MNLAISTFIHFQTKVELVYVESCRLDKTRKENVNDTLLLTGKEGFQPLLSLQSIVKGLDMRFLQNVFQHLFDSTSNFYSKITRGEGGLSVFFFR